MSKRKPSSPPPLPDPLTPEGAAALRRAAEAVSQEQGPGRPQAGTGAGKTPDERGLIEELRIHHIELELQNQSLRATRLQLEASLKRYAALYDFAPIALLTLSDNGTIRDANQSAVDLLGQPLSALRGRRLGLFVSDATRAAFNDLLTRALLGEAGTPRELVLMPPQQPSRWVQVEGINVTQDHQPQIQLALTDISHRKVLEDSLREKEELFHAILNNASDGISYLDLKTQGYLFVNPALLDLSGFTTEEMEGFTPQQFHDRVHPEDREKVEAQHRRLALGLDPKTIQYRWRVKQGDYRWLNDSGKLVHDAGGHPIGLVDICRDITRVKQHDIELHALNASLEQRVAERTAELKDKIAEIQQAAERLRISEEHARGRLIELEAIYATAPVGLAVLDTELRFWRLNEGLAAMNGQSVEAHLGRRLHEILPRLADEIEPQLRRVLASGEPLHSELVGETPAYPGERRTWQENIYPLRASDGRVIGLNIVTEDITERKRAEDNLRESEGRFRDLFEHLPIAYQSVDHEGRWLDANQKMAELLGFAKPKEMLGLNFVDYWDPSIRDQFDANFACFKENFSTHGELALRRRDGRPLTVLVAGRIQRDDQGRFLRTHCILFDITERRAMEDEIRTLNQDLELKVEERTAEARAASAAKSEFLAHMSHEIRTPLNAILGLAQLLGRGSLDETQHQQVARILEAGDNLLAILNDILDFSKIESGKLPLDAQPFDLKDILCRIESFLGRLAHAKGLPFRIDCPPLPVGALLGDPLRLGQVLTNLIGNAIKFTLTGEVSLRIQVLETGEEPETAGIPETTGGAPETLETPEVQKTRAARETAPGALRLRFEVADTGIGIEPEVLARLFQPFSQGDSSITRRFGGTGLGLVISKRLVELMGGEIGATSQPGRGSTFWFELPFTLTGPALEPGAEPARDEASGQRLAGWHLLVVDDSDLNREVVDQALRLEGAVVTMAREGAEALELLRHHPEAYQAVLMDVQMPVMDGLTAARRIRAELGLIDLPIIALTAGALAQERQAALAAGMNDVLTKPVRLEAMVAMIRRQGESAAEKVQTPPPQPSPARGEEAGKSEAGAAEAAPGREGSERPGAGAAAPQAEAFPPIPGIDREQATEILCGNRTLFLQLLGLFLLRNHDLVGRVREELAQGHGDTAARWLHNLRGNAGSLGARAMMALAQQLEEAIDNGETDLEANLTELDRQLRELNLASAPWLELAPPQRL